MSSIFINYTFENTRGKQLKRTFELKEVEQGILNSSKFKKLKIISRKLINDNLEQSLITIKSLRIKKGHLSDVLVEENILGSKYENE